MIVSAKSKISDIIKENIGAIDVIASINTHFQKLKNPLLRKLLAPRINVEEAAKIGGVKVTDILERLESIGFEIDKNSGEARTLDSALSPSVNDFLSGHEVVYLNVKPMISDGHDPIKEILKSVGILKADQILCIINFFEPIPLMNLLKNKGFDSYTVVLEKDKLYHTFFKKVKEEKTVADLAAIKSSRNFSFESRIVKEIDVRGMEMPLPMITIMNELPGLAGNEVLKVLHFRIPHLLLKELDQKGFNYKIEEYDDSLVLLYIYK